jgi:hypothetical protein
LSLLDKNTFGDSRAAEVLVDMLNASGDPKLVRRVCRLFTLYSQTMGELKVIKSRKVYRCIASLWLERCKTQALNNALPPKVLSYLNNIEQSLYKTAIRELDGKTRKGSRICIQTRRFKPCPCCGSTEWPKLSKEIAGFSGEMVFALACGNKQCPVKPTTSYCDTIDEANKNWNRQKWSMGTEQRLIHVSRTEVPHE